MGVTLYLSGVGGNLKIKNVLGGELMPPGQKAVKVDWPNGFLQVSNKSADTGMDMCFDAIEANIPNATEADPLIVAGHSGGAQVIGKLLRERQTDIDDVLAAWGKTRACLKFYLLGFPESKFYGTCYLNTADDPPKYPGDPTKGGVVH